MPKLWAMDFMVYLNIHLILMKTGSNPANIDRFRRSQSTQNRFLAMELKRVLLFYIENVCNMIRFDHACTPF